MIVCGIAAFQSTGNFYLSSSAIITRDVIKNFFFKNMRANEQIFVSRIVIMLVFFAALSIAFISVEKILSLGSFSLSMGCQMLIPIIALCYFPWFTRDGIAMGLIVGISVVFLTEEVGQIVFRDVLPWNKWPFTIHSSAWGVFFNFLSASVISFVTQDVK